MNFRRKSKGADPAPTDQGLNGPPAPARDRRSFSMPSMPSVGIMPVVYALSIAIIAMACGIIACCVTGNTGPVLMLAYAAVGTCVLTAVICVAAAAKGAA